MKSRALLALTASALALPGLSGKSRADTAPTESTLSWRISRYEEDELPRRHLLAGSRERYGIGIHQFRLLVPRGDTLAFQLSGSYEHMSGASPWYLLRSNGEAGVVMSGATIDEQRSDLSLGVQRYLDEGNYTVQIAGSRENDYDSLSASFGMERHFNNELSTVAGGLSWSDDELHPSDAALFNRVAEADKRTGSVFLSFTQVIDAASVFQTGLSFTRHLGFLSDPYKLGDSRPGARSQWAWSNAYRRFFSDPSAALHLDYRYYHDDFGVRSHTLELNWHQNLLDGDLRVIPGLRYYSQSGADFYRPVNDFSLLGVHQSSDYRLAPYGALSANLGLELQLAEFRLHLSLERYLADASWSLFEVEEENPALVRFTRLSLGLDYDF